MGETLNTLIARNAESFSFIYQENIDRLGNVRFFDPEKDVPQLDGIDLLYLPGGYPEKHVEALVANEACRKAIKRFAEQGGRIVAECGGMMYLGKSLTDQDGKIWPMAGVLPIECTMQGARLHLGYRRMTIGSTEFRGHEFHYSKIDAKGSFRFASLQFDARGEKVDTELFRYKNVIAGYTHWYWGESDINAFWEL